MKSITPVISVILLIMLTIATSAAAFFFINSSVTDLEAQGNLESFPGSDNSRLNLVSITGSKAIVRNDGTTPVTEVVMFVNGELLNYTLSTPIQPGELKEIIFNAREVGEDLEIKVIYNTGKTVEETSPASKNIESSGFIINPIGLNDPFLDPSIFFSTWYTDQLTLPLPYGGIYNFTVNWGDGSSGEVTSYNDPDASHTYSQLGEYNISINGTIEGFRFYVMHSDRFEILNIRQWGNLKLGDLGYYFYGCKNLTISATDLLNTTGMTNMIHAFAQTNISSVPNIENWDMSKVTSFSAMFYEAIYFNDNINEWDTSSATDMSWLFCRDYAFNQPLNNWNTSSVTNMRNMFASVSRFNYDITNWDVSKVGSMFYMFDGASSFNQNIGLWNVSSVSTMYNMKTFNTYTTPIYDQILEGWSSLPYLQYDVPMHAGYTTKYCNITAHNILANDYRWVISDGGYAGDEICLES
ncbi:MAG: BspA family leucine-rich repeat surface protein [Candidatus Nanoarchaeia archaeon]|nr:BspA family leucine-rich repeat surface protein [Candidatus Nanoarchaeia archaeon]